MKKVILLAALAAASGASLGAVDGRYTRGAVQGVDLITYRTEVKDVIDMDGALPAGDAMGEGGNIAVPTLTGMMLDRGTKALDKFAIADKLESVGAEISFSVGPQSLGLRAKCLKKDLPLVLGLLAADLRTPAFKSDEFAKAKQQFIGGLQASEQNTEARAQESFNRAVFPGGHPNRPHTVAEYEAAAKSATLDEVKSFYAKYYGPAHFTLVVAGDVDADAVRNEINKQFAGWNGGQDYLKSAKPAAAAAPQDLNVPIAEKTSVTMILGQATGLRYKDPDALALRVGTAVLGQGFTGRLMGTVRDKEGLTYHIGAGVAEDTIVDGNWAINASFAPTLLAKGVDSTRRVLEAWWKDGITEQELAARKKGLIGGYQVSLSTTGGIAGAILTNAQRGLDVTWLDEYPKAVNALTRDQVDAAIKTHLNPADMVLVKAGSLPH